MNSKFKFCVFGILIFVSAVIITVFSENCYGLPFEYDFVCLIFTFIEFSCISIICKVNEDCLFCNEYKAIRYRKRTSIIKTEIIKRIFYIIIFSIIHNAVVLIIKKLEIKEIVLMVVLNFLELLFLILIQFYIEIKINSDMGFLLVLVMYIVLVFSGIMLYKCCQSNFNTISNMLELINKFNIVNYSSFTRIKLLNCNINQSVFVLLGVDVFTLIIILFGLRKSDILERG